MIFNTICFRFAARLYTAMLKVGANGEGRIRFAARLRRVKPA